jgi:hypothetical protein
MRPDLLDAIEAAVFVARRGADDHLVIEFANAAFRAAADLCEKVTGLPAESVMPAAWVGAVAEAAARGSAELPPAGCPGGPGCSPAWSAASRTASRPAWSARYPSRSDRPT